MKNYLRWSLRQLYLIFFCPTRFKREVEGDMPDHKPRASESIHYLLKMLPWVVTFTVLGNLVGGYVYEVLGISVQWEDSWVRAGVGVTFGVAVGLAFGVAGRMAYSVAFGVAAGVGFGVAYCLPNAVMNGVAVGVAYSVAARVAVGLAFGVAFGVPLGMVFSVAFGAAVGLVNGARFGVILGVVFGVVLGVPLGMTLGAVFGAAVGVGVGVAFWLTYFRVVTYPVDLAFSAATYFGARRGSLGAARAWKLCPVAWNEMIWLPLPFVSKLLALLARQDREEGFRQIAFVAAERLHQGRAVLATLTAVAVDDLKAESLPQLSDVTERLSWTTDASVSLPVELATALPRLDRVAQHVGQYLILHSAYRRAETLERAANETAMLQQSLIAAGGRFAPRLLRVINEWRGLLDAERNSVRVLAEASREIPNPFVYGNPVMETEHNVFTGRQDVVRQIEASLLGAAQAPTLLLQGPRRMGKTSILNQLPRLLGPDFAPAVIDCQNPAVMGSEATLLRYLSRALSAWLRRRHVVIEALAVKQLEREPYAVFDEWLEWVERAMPHGMRALLCLDEYEHLQLAINAGWGTTFLDALRHTFQHRPRVVLMFTGAHTFQELGLAWTDRFISARRIRVSFLTRADVELLLTKPIPEFDMTYAAGALDALVAATNCHPFLTQAVAFELVQLLNEGQRREATPEDVEVAVWRSLGSGEAYFVNVWGDAGAQGQAILRALAMGMTPPHFPTANAWLREHDVISADGDFAVEMMRRWVAAKAAA